MDGVGAPAEALGDLARREPREVAQQEDGPLVLRQRAQRLGERGDGLGTRVLGGRAPRWSSVSDGKGRRRRSSSSAALRATRNSQPGNGALRSS